MFVATAPEQLNIHGGKRYLFYNAPDLGLWNKNLNPLTSVQSWPVPVAGFEHFQLWCITTVNLVQIEARIGAWSPHDYLGTTSTYLCPIGTFGAHNFARTLYFGVGLDPPASSMGDKIRFSGSIVLNFRNLDPAVGTLLSAGLECMG